MLEQRFRMAAYAVCRSGDRVLLARYVSPDESLRHWTLPGGRVEHGEDPYHAVVREVAEETGYEVEVERLLGLDSRTMRVDRGTPGKAQLHRVGVFYRVRVTGGELRHEVDGTTDLAAWVGRSDVPKSPRAFVVDTGLELDRAVPPVGRVEPVPVGGLLRY